MLRGVPVGLPWAQCSVLLQQRMWSVCGRGACRQPGLWHHKCRPGLIDGPVPLCTKNVSLPLLVISTGEAETGQCCCTVSVTAERRVNTKKSVRNTFLGWVSTLPSSFKENSSYFKEIFVHTHTQTKGLFSIKILASAYYDPCTEKF